MSSSRYVPGVEGVLTCTVLVLGIAGIYYAVSSIDEALSAYAIQANKELAVCKNKCAPYGVNAIGPDDVCVCDLTKVRR